MDEDDLYLANRKRRRYFLYGSFLMCLLGAALTATAFGTQNWMEAALTNSADETLMGDFNSGLFQGQSTQSGLSTSTFVYRTVCMEGKCLFSCGKTKGERERHLTLILEGNLTDTSKCEEDTRSAASGRANAQTNALRLSAALEQSASTKDQYSSSSVLQAAMTLARRLSRSTVGGGEALARRLQQTPISPWNAPSDEDEDDTTDDLSSLDGLLSQGLWAGTIACLGAGLLFAVLGAVFAVINTATTPVEAITGIPGLYIWNGLAALFELVAVVLWSVQFTKHLTHNVLLVDSNEGWTTEGNEKLGYSFWLVVVAVAVHLANCGLIAFGTYEPKVKEKVQGPDKATTDILLY